MNRLLDLQLDETFCSIQISEKELQRILLKNFGVLFSEYILLSSEFKLLGDVRKLGVGGRIDILALDINQFQLVVFELKTTHTKHILVQAIEYCDYIEDNLELILLKNKNLDDKIRKRILALNKKPKIVLIANKFLHPSIKKIERLDLEVELFEYEYYENGFIRISKLDYTFQKKNHNQINLGKHIQDFDSLAIVISLIESGVISDERYCKIELDEIFINGQNTYNIYRDYCFSNNDKPVSKSIFINSLKTNPNYIGFLSKKDFEFNRTSAYHLKICKI